MIRLCPPAIIYVIFSITQIIIDTFKGMYNTALMKVIVMIMITLLLNILCESGLNVISWIIVFIPFILMTVIVTMLLYIFGLSAYTGTIHYSSQPVQKNVPTYINGVYQDPSGNIVVYDPNYDPLVNPVYYQSPNVIVPKPPTNKNIIVQPAAPSNYSSSPAYESFY